ncbi:MAG: acylphosphatase, partial [Mariprofundales bacterium]|nr:acylphosphatase [Mariprofundales bacterium]
MDAVVIHIQGVVQGVGFRPAVWHIANRLDITGSVWNSGTGVVINAWGASGKLAEFNQQIVTNLPPLARIDSLTTSPLDPRHPPATFTIERSKCAAHLWSAIAPDAATCPHCLADMASSEDRHHGYAFTSCSYCGPRLSIVHAVPYDRTNTSMREFTICSACQAEYETPADRRFHA